MEEPARPHARNALRRRAATRRPGQSTRARPRLLLCDEPVSALDLANRHALLEQLRKVQQALAVPMLYVTHSPAEALALGSRLFLLEAGRIVARGQSARRPVTERSVCPAGSNTWEGVRNVFPARVANHDAAQDAQPARARTAGPSLTVPFLDLRQGTPVLVAVRADDILLSETALSGLSAPQPDRGSRRTNRSPRARGGGHRSKPVKLTWIVSVVELALEQLAILPGAVIHLIIKARSCQILDPDSSPPTK